MRRLPINDGWYGFATLNGDWGSLSLTQNIIRSSRGNINFVDKPLFLVGESYNGKFLLGGQSQSGKGTIFYTDGEWFQIGDSFGVSPCAFSQGGKFFYFVTSGQTGKYRNNNDGIITSFLTPFFVDGIRAVIPPNNEIILGNTTNYSPQYDLHEYIKFDERLVVGQGDNGLIVWFDGVRYLVEPGDARFIRAQYNGTNLALASVNQVTKQTIFWWLNTAELIANFPIDNASIERINKECWLGWYEFVNDPNPLPTANCLMRVKELGTIKKLNNQQVFSWITGDTIAKINDEAVNHIDRIVAYYDNRIWPEWPSLAPNDYISLQAYCRSNESIKGFELDMQLVISSVPDQFQNIALTCQCFTSNDGLTKDLRSLVAVYARLAKNNPRVKMLLVFSDQGRATGLNDHPEVRPYWQELFDGITGIPEDGQMSEQMPQDVYAVCQEMWEKFHQECIDNHPGDNDSASRELTERIVEQVVFSFPDQGWCWKSADPNRPPSKDSIARQFNGFWGYDMYQASGANGPRFFNPYPPPVNDLEGQNPIELAGHNWLGEQPPVGDINILIFNYTKVVRRSDPLGLVMQYEVESSIPVEFEEFYLVGDGEPSIRIQFIPENKRDGRYFRAVAWKPVVNGRYFPEIVAVDLNGNLVTKRGDVPVEVTF